MKSSKIMGHSRSGNGRAAVMLGVDEPDLLVLHLDHAAGAGGTHAVVAVGGRIGRTEIIRAHLSGNLVLHRQHQLSGNLQFAGTAARQGGVAREHLL